MQQGRSGLRVFLATAAVTAAAALLLPVTAGAATATQAVGAPSISAGGRLLPGYNVTPSVSNVDYSKGPLQLHYFGSVYSFDDPMDFYRFFARVPSSTTAGTHRVWATQNGSTVAETYPYVSRLSPQVTPSSWWLTVGEKLQFSGNGFRPGEPTRLYVNGVNSGISVTAGQSTPFYYDIQGMLPGYFPYAAPDAALTYVVPNSLRGTTAVFEVRGAWSGASDRVSITVAG